MSELPRRKLTRDQWEQVVKNQDPLRGYDLMGHARRDGLVGAPRDLLIARVEELEARERILKSSHQDEVKRLKETNDKLRQSENDQYSRHMKELREQGERHNQREIQLRHERTDMENKLRKKISELEAAIVEMGLILASRATKI